MARPTSPTRWADTASTNRTAIDTGLRDVGFPAGALIPAGENNQRDFEVGEWLTYLSDISVTRTVDLVVNPSLVNVYQFTGATSGVVISRTDDELQIINGSGGTIGIRMPLDLNIEPSAYATPPTFRVTTITTWRIFGKTSGSGGNTIDASIFRKTLVGAPSAPNFTTSLTVVSAMTSPTGITPAGVAPYASDPAGRSLLPAVIYGGASHYLSVDIEDGTTFEFAELRITCTITDA